MMPPLPHELVPNFGLNMGSHLEEEYHMKRVVARGLLERAEHRRQTLVGDYNEIMRLRDEVQTEFNEYGHEVHAKCCELRTALDTRESLLMSSLERMRKVKEKSLNSDSVHCREQLDQLQQLCASIARLMETERDADIFFAKAAMPEMQLRAILEHSNEWHPDVEVSFGAKLEIGFATDALRQLDFSFPSEIRTGGSSSAALQGVPQAAAVSRAGVMQNLSNLLNQKTAEKTAALAVEDYLEAARLKKEIGALEEETVRVQSMPDEDTGLLKQIAALREEKARLVSAENYLAAAAVKRDLTELENKAGITALPPVASAQSPEPAPEPVAANTPTPKTSPKNSPQSKPKSPEQEPDPLPEPMQNQEAKVRCEITLDEDFQAWSPGKTGDTGVKTIASNIGVQANQLTVIEAKMTIRSLASVGKADEAPPGSLILCIEVGCDMVRSVTLMKKLETLGRNAKNGEVYFGETMVYELSQPIVESC